MITAATSCGRLGANNALRRAVPGLVTGLLVLSLISGSLPASADQPPERGMFLVATPDLGNSGFSRSVILLIQHDADGTMGLIINQRTNFDPAILLPDIEGLARFGGSLYAGGPVATYGVMMLVKSGVPPGDAAHVFADVYASGSKELLLDIVKRGDAANRVRLYAGHAGWLAGQLDEEIERGSWIVTPANESLVFSGDPDSVWKHLSPTTRPIIVQQGKRKLRL